MYRGGTIYNVGDLLIEETSITGSRTTASAIANAHTNRAFAGAIYDNHGGVSYEGKLDGNLYLNSA